jgi:hypothetical protein
LGEVVPGDLRIYEHGLICLLYFARSEREFSEQFAAAVVVGDGRMDGFDLFEAKRPDGSLDVSFIFVHLCDGIDSLSNYNKGTLQLA